MLPTSHQLVRYYSARPQVNFLGVALLCDKLWRHVDWSAGPLIMAQSIVLFSAQTKINYLYIVAIIFHVFEEDVLWLEVTMHNVGLVAVVDA